MEVGIDNSLFGDMAEIAKMYAHAQRLVMLEHTLHQELSVEQLSEISGLSFANTSQHLLLMRRIGLLQSRREGKRVLYRSSGEHSVMVLKGLQSFAKHMQMVQHLLIRDSQQDPNSLELIPQAELLRLLAEGAVTLLDVRPEAEFETLHIGGARNIPIEELLARINELDPSQEIIAYCRGPHCVLSEQAVDVLRARGFRARRYLGVPQASLGA